MAAQKCSDRRKILRKVQALVSSLIQLNEAAYQTGKTLEATDAETISTTIDSILSAGGLQTDMTGAANTISDEIGGILAGGIEDADVGAVLS